MNGHLYIVPEVKFSCYCFTGKVNGKGYYIYEKGGKPKPDPSVQRVIEEYRKHAKTMPGGKVLLSLPKHGLCIY
jgi:hypothetical protein